VTGRLGEDDVSDGLDSGFVFVNDEWVGLVSYT
jgi:hypothetical protein